MPVPWSNLAFHLKPRAGNLMLVAAAAGVGKSMLASNWMVGIVEQGLPCLYVSLDTSLDDQAVRFLSLTQRKTTAEIEQGRDDDHEAWVAAWSGVLSEYPHKRRLRFTDRPSTIRHIEECIVAETELAGRPPAMTVVDNVADLLEEEESAAEYHRIFGGLRRVARNTQTLVMALHHLRRKPARFGATEQDQGTKPVMKTDVLYGGDREAQYLLGLYRARPDVLTVSILKNRMGRADASSNLNVRLKADYEKGAVREDVLLDFASAPARREPEGDWRRRWEEEHGYE